MLVSDGQCSSIALKFVTYAHVDSSHVADQGGGFQYDPFEYQRPGLRCRVVVITKREKVGALHALCAAGKEAGGLWGFGTRRIKGKMLVNAAKQILRSSVVHVDPVVLFDRASASQWWRLTLPRAGHCIAHLRSQGSREDWRHTPAA